MGRRPNALILQYFERGPKLQDQSNRYPHTCKKCGEHFPRGRLDTLTSHLTKKCPGISESDRMNALLTLSGMSAASQRIHQGHPNGQPSNQAMGAPSELMALQHDTEQQTQSQQTEGPWSALGVLAEVSRQFTQHETNNERAIPSQNPPSLGLGVSAGGLSAPLVAERAIEDTGDENATQGTKTEPDPTDEVALIQRAEQRLQEALRANALDDANLTVAAAATARLHPALLDPQLLGAEAAAAAEAATAAVSTAVAAAAAVESSSQSPIDPPSVPTTSAGQPWGEITYITEAFQPSQVSDSMQGPPRMGRGGFRLEANGAKSRHSRQRFTPERREQVKDVRKIGACIRCRVLRKTCSMGETCDTCKKVLSPRIWKHACCRTKLTDQLDMYTASVQIVLAQTRVNNLKQAGPLANHGISVELYHLPEVPTRMSLQVLQFDTILNTEAGSHSPAPYTDLEQHPIRMLDADKQDLPAKVEVYLREILPEFIEREASPFVQTTLKWAVQLANETNDELLRKVLDLWGYVEMMDRDNQWIVRADMGPDGPQNIYISEKDDAEAYATIRLQMAAAVERKAGTTSKTLLLAMQRILQDSKVRVDFATYLATLILLHCVEKSTWIFTAWEQVEDLRKNWPLPKDPSSFSRQGRGIADLLRMLLEIRKALPRTACREVDGKLITEEENSRVREYFEAINLDYGQVKAQQDSATFSQTDPRSFDLLFCSTLLLPPPPPDFEDKGLASRA